VSLSGATPKRETSTTGDGLAAGQSTLLRSQEISAMSEREKGQIAHLFREKLVLLKQLRAKAASQREELASRKPNPFLIADYGRAYSIQVDERYRDYVKEIEGKVPAASFHELIKWSYELRYPQFLLEMAASNDDVASMPMRDIVRSLLDETDFQRAIVDQLANLEGLDAQNLQGAEGADAVLTELSRLAPQLNRSYAEKSAAILPQDRRYSTYVDDQFRSLVIQGVVTAYKSARMVEVEKVENEAQQVAAELNSLMRRLPVLSDERVQLATDFSAAIR
jgi:hypothetical protein